MKIILTNCMPIVHEAVTIPREPQTRYSGYVKLGNIDCYYIPVIAIFGNDWQREKQSAFMRSWNRLALAMSNSPLESTDDWYGKHIPCKRWTCISTVLLSFVYLHAFFPKVLSLHALSREKLRELFFKIDLLVFVKSF